MTFWVGATIPLASTRRCFFGYSDRSENHSNAVVNDRSDNCLSLILLIRKFSIILWSMGPDDKDTLILMHILRIELTIDNINLKD